MNGSGFKTFVLILSTAIGKKNICGLAVTCIGHLARIHGKIEKERIFELFNQQKDNPYISNRIEDAIDDINMFVHE